MKRTKSGRDAATGMPGVEWVEGLEVNVSKRLGLSCRKALEYGVGLDLTQANALAVQQAQR